MFINKGKTMQLLYRPAALVAVLFIVSLSPLLAVESVSVLPYRQMFENTNNGQSVGSSIEGWVFTNAWNFAESGGTDDSGCVVGDITNKNDDSASDILLYVDFGGRTNIDLSYNYYSSKATVSNRVTASVDGGSSFFVIRDWFRTPALSRQIVSNTDFSNMEALANEENVIIKLSFKLSQSAIVDETLRLDNLVIQAGRMPASEFYITTTGDDANGGTGTGDAWATLQHALDSISSNDFALGDVIVNIEPGTYTGDLLKTDYKNTALLAAGPGRRLVVRGNGGAVIAQQAGYSAANMKQDGLDWVIVSNITYNDYTTSVPSVFLMEYNTNIYFSGLTFLNRTNYADGDRNPMFEMDWVANVYLSNIIVSNCDTGIELSKGTNIHLYNCTFTRNDYSMDVYNIHDLSIRNSTFTFQKLADYVARGNPGLTDVTNLTFINNTVASNMGYNGGGAVLGSGEGFIHVISNRFEANGSTNDAMGICRLGMGSTDNIVAYNTFKYLGSNVNYLLGLRMGHGNVFNNTFYKSSGGGIIVDSSGYTVNISNNLFIDIVSNYVYDDGGDTFVGHNVYYNSSNLAGSIDGELNNTNSNPFVDTNTLEITNTNSSAYRAGVPVAFFNHQIAPDIGARKMKIVPVLETSYPTNGMIDVKLTSNIILNFNTAVLDKGMSVTVSNNTDNNLFESIGSGLISGFGTSRLVLNPSVDFPENKRLTVLIPAGFISNSDGNENPSYFNTNVLSFRTTKPPFLLSNMPPDGTSIINVNEKLRLFFDEEVFKGDGAIVISNKTSGDVIELSASSPYVSKQSLSNIVIETPISYEVGDDYSIFVSNDAFYDTASNYYSGILNQTDWELTVTVAPHILSNSPTNGYYDYDTNEEITLYLNEAVLAGDGSFILTNETDSSRIVLPATDAGVDISGSVITLDFGNLKQEKRYTLLIESNAFSNSTSGNTAVVDRKYLSFTTRPAPANFSTSFEDADGWEDHSSMGDSWTDTTVFGDWTTEDGPRMDGLGDRTGARGWTSWTYEYLEFPEVSSPSTITIWAYNNTVTTNYFAVQRHNGTDWENADVVEITNTNETFTNYTFYLEGNNPRERIRLITKNNIDGYLYADDLTISPTVYTTPIIEKMSPSDNNTNVPNNASLGIRFDKPVYQGSGNIVISNITDGNVFETIDASSSAISGLGDDKIAVDVSHNFEQGKEYCVLIDAGTFEDGAANGFLGISSPTYWNFKISSVDIVAPVPLVYTPGKNADTVATNTDVTLIFDEPIAKTRSGYFTLRVLSNEQIHTRMKMTNDYIQVQEETNLVIYLQDDTLDLLTEYYITIESTCITDVAGNYYPGVYSTNWTFTTKNDLLSATNIFISATGDDGNDGSYSSPFASLQKALNSLTPAHLDNRSTVIIFTNEGSSFGTTAVSAEFTNSALANGSSPSSRIIIKGGGGLPELNAAADALKLHSPNLKHIVFSNLSFISGQPSSAVFSISNAHSLSFLNLSFKNAASQTELISLYGATNVSILDSSFLNSAADSMPAIQLIASKGVVISNCDFKSNSYSLKAINSTNVYLKRSRLDYHKGADSAQSKGSVYFEQCSGVYIFSNSFRSNAAAAADLYLKACNTDVSVASNFFSSSNDAQSSTRSSFLVLEESSAAIYYNIFDRGSAGFSAQLSKQDAAAAGFTFIAQNTFYASPSNAFEASGSSGSEVCALTNNIFAESSGFDVYDNSSAVNVSADYNVKYNGAGYSGLTDGADDQNTDPMLYPVSFVFSNTASSAYQNGFQISALNTGANPNIGAMGYQNVDFPSIVIGKSNVIYSPIDGSVLGNPIPGCEVEIFVHLTNVGSAYATNIILEESINTTYFGIVSNSAAGGFDEVHYATNSYYGGYTPQSAVDFDKIDKIRFVKYYLPSGSGTTNVEFSYKIMLK